ncbi:MAG: YceD family protein, partial [Candidatus Rokuibacteriota bacterium]
MLQVDLRELGRGPVDTAGELPQDDPLFEGLDVALTGPVRVTGRLQATGEGRYFWHGGVRAAVSSHCRRCLTPVTVPVAASVGALFSRDADALEDPDAYALAPDARAIDLRPAVREELMLAAPQYVL